MAYVNGRSGSFPVTTSNRYIEGPVNWAEKYDEAANRSQVTVSLRLKRTNTGYTTEGNGTFYLTVDGQKQSNSGYFVLTGSAETLCIEKTFTVAHESDGSRSVTITVSGKIESGSPDMVLSAQSATVKLTTIPRKATFTGVAGDKYLGRQLTLSFDSQSSSLTHNITYTYGTKQGTVATGLQGKSTCVWTPPNDLARGIAANLTKAACTLTITTFSGGTSVGQDTTSFTLSIPDTAEFRPEITGVTLSLVNGNATVAGWNRYVQGYSKVRVVISAKENYGSALETYEISVPGGGTVKGGSRDLTSNTLSTSGTKQVTVSVTNRRGFTVRKTIAQNISVTAYAKPVVSVTALTRCDAAGNEAGDGVYCRLAGLKASRSVTENRISLTLHYRLAGSGSWSPQGGAVITGSTTSYSANYRYPAAVFAITQAYQVRVTVTDLLGNSASVTKTLPAAGAILNVRPSGKGMGIGVFSSADEQLDIGWKAKFFNTVTLDVPLAVGSGGTGAGTAEQAVQALQSEYIGAPTNYIPAGANLNNYTTPGTYRCANTATAATLLNSPLSSGNFVLVVRGVTSTTSDYLTQEIRPCGTSGLGATLFLRSKVAGTWYAWATVLTDRIVQYMKFNATTVTGQTYVDITGFDGLTTSSLLLATCNRTSTTATLEVKYVCCPSSGTVRVIWANTPETSVSVPFSVLWI